MSGTVCPGCGRGKTRRARLCRSCRRAANTAGESVILHRITGGQIRAFHAKANELDRKREQPFGTAKREALSRAGVTSTKLLSETAASEAIDGLEERLRP